MPLVADGWETLWEAHWPLNRCEMVDHGLHDVRATGRLMQCVNCNKWMDAAEEPAFLAAAWRITQLLNDRHRKN